MKISKCAVCNQKKFKKIITIFLSAWKSTKNSSLERKGLKFELAQCFVCGHQMLLGNFNKSTKDSFYKPASIKFTPQVISANPSINSDILHYTSKYVNISNPTIMDFGCGDLSLLKLVKDQLKHSKKKRLIGIDFSFTHPKSIEGIDYINSDLNQTNKNVKLKNLTFDYGFLVHTLEHLPNPRKSLADIRNLMSENSFLYIEVPANELLNSINLIALDIICPQHLHYFNLDSLTALVTSNGFKVISSDLEVTNQIPRIKMTIRKKIFDENFFTMSKASKNIQNIYKYSANTILKLSNNSRVAVWGIGEDFDKMLKINHKLNNKLMSGELILLDTYLYGKQWRGNKIIHPKDLKIENVNKIILTPLTDHVRNDMLKQSKSWKLQKVKLIDPYYQLTI